MLVDGEVHNDRSLELLARTAVSHADAGADVVAPSDMMDGRVAVIREALDDGGFESTPILAYSAKYASAFYGPFREAAGSAPSFGDRRGYQMDPANAREALRECELDLDEGADAIMIKPALPYLDVIRAARDSFDVPLGAYNVSGEYAMIKAAARSGWLDERQAALESLTAIRRAGDVGRLACDKTAAVRPLLKHAHRSGELLATHRHRALERVDAALTPEVDVRRRQPAESDEHVDRADGLPLGQGGLGRTDDAPLEILRSGCHGCGTILARREPETDPSRRSRRFGPRWNRT